MAGRWSGEEDFFVFWHENYSDRESGRIKIYSVMLFWVPFHWPPCSNVIKLLEFNGKYFEYTYRNSIGYCEVIDRSFTIYAAEYWGECEVQSRYSHILVKIRFQTEYNGWFSWEVEISIEIPVIWHTLFQHFCWQILTKSAMLNARNGTINSLPRSCRTNLFVFVLSRQKQ